MTIELAASILGAVFVLTVFWLMVRTMRKEPQVGCAGDTTHVGECGSHDSDSGDASFDGGGDGGGGGD